MNDERNRNEQRADWGLDAVYAAAIQTNVWNQDDARTAITDVLAYVAHLCDRVGLIPETVFANAIQSYMGDFEDGPPAETLPARDAVDPDERFLRDLFPNWRRGQFGQAHDALGVIALDPRIRAWLMEHDPKALAQVESARGAIAGSAAKPVVLCVRNPDHENEYTVDGDVEIIGVDLGRSFNGPKDFDPESDWGQDWLASTRKDIAHLPADSKVRRAVEELLEELGGEEGDQ